MKLALQIYSLRGFLTTDRINETLSRVYEMGYDGVEWYGLMNHTPVELAHMTEKAGLRMFSLHRSIDDILECNTSLLDAVAGVGVKYLPIGWLPPERLANGPLFHETCDAIRRYSDLAAARGMYLLYHNHDFDLVRCGNTPLLDLLMEALPETVIGMEPDTCWLYSGGVDPETYLHKYIDRAPIIHVKDCVAGGGRKGFMPVGSGVLDWNGILTQCRKADWLCVEQDEPSKGLDAFECARKSASFLKDWMKRLPN